MTLTNRLLLQIFLHLQGVLKSEHLQTLRARFFTFSLL